MVYNFLIMSLKIVYPPALSHFNVAVLYKNTQLKSIYDLEHTH
jgi:hypothetical protein